LCLGAGADAGWTGTYQTELAGASWDEKVIYGKST
jgi:hypothetical protein